MCVCPEDGMMKVLGESQSSSMRGSKFSTFKKGNRNYLSTDELNELIVIQRHHDCQLNDGWNSLHPLVSTILK